MHQSTELSLGLSEHKRNKKNRIHVPIIKHYNFTLNFIHISFLNVTLEFESTSTVTSHNFLSEVASWLWQLLGLVLGTDEKHLVAVSFVERGARCGVVRCAKWWGLYCFWRFSYIANMQVQSSKKNRPANTSPVNAIDLIRRDAFYLLGPRMKAPLAALRSGVRFSISV